MTRRGAIAAMGGAAAVAGVLVARALWWEPRHVCLTHHELLLPRWPAELDGLVVAVVADLHTGGPHVGLTQLGRVVAGINRAAPDLVALLGDYADPEVLLGERIEPEPVAEVLSRLRPPVVAVLGNHDWHHWGSRMPAALRAAGLTVLENDAVCLELRGLPLWVAGVADAGTRSPSLGSLRAIPEGEPVLVLSHHPDVFPHVPARVALTLSGHLHGSQVNLPLLRGRVSRSRHGTRFLAAHVEEDGRHLFVTRGVGTSRLPVRFLASPEVALLTLRPAR